MFWKMKLSLDLQFPNSCREERVRRSPRPWWTGQEAVVLDDSSAHGRPLHHSVLSSLGFQKKDVRMLRFIQEVNTTTRSCALWDLEEDTEYIVHVQSISIQGQSPASEPVLFKTPREAEKLASKNKDEVTMKEMAKKNQQLRAGEILIIVVVLFMWAGVIALFCRQYDIIKDNEPNNSKEKVKSASENSTPEHQSGGLLRSKFPKNKPSVNIIEA
ncbi:fibronectin type III domain-containing protein 5 isoform 2-T2 [Morphnus guianensis]